MDGVDTATLFAMDLDLAWELFQKMIPLAYISAFSLLGVTSHLIELAGIILVRNMRPELHVDRW